MTNQIKYFIGSLFAIPFLPIMYIQGKRIRKTIPELPEASKPSGVIGNGTRQFNLLTMGESTIAGVGVDTHQNGFTGALAKIIAQQGYSVKWKVVAQSGFTAAKVLSDLTPKIGDFQPNLIVIGLGANDAFELNSPLTWRKNMTKLIRLLHKKFPTSNLVCLNMPPIKQFPAMTPLLKVIMGNLIELLGKDLKNLASHYDYVFYVDKDFILEDWLDQTDTSITINDFFSDGVHPSPLAYQKWGEDVGNFIIEQNLLMLTK